MDKARRIRRRFGVGRAEAAVRLLERIEDTGRLAGVGEWVAEVFPAWFVGAGKGEA